MPFDAHKNLAISEIAVAPVPADSGTTLSVPAGHGTRFATPPFNATVWPKRMPEPDNATIIRITSIVGDELTFLRLQEDTANRAILVGDLIVATVTVKMLEDIESGQNFPSISTGDVTSSGTVQAVSLGTTPLDAAKLTGTVPNAALSGTTLATTVQAHDTGLTSLQANAALKNAANTFTPTQTFAGKAIVGSTQDPSVGTTNVMMSVAGNMAFEGPGEHYFGNRTEIGADSNILTLCGGGPTPGGTATANRGAAISVNGIDAPGNPGGINMQAANKVGADVRVQTNDTNRFRVFYDGGVVVGPTATSPGLSNLSVVGNVKAANLKWIQGHTWGLLGDLGYAATLTWTPSMFVYLTGTQTVRIVGIVTRIVSGTSIGVQLYAAGAAVASVTASAPPQQFTALNIPLANGSEILLAISAPVGAPQTLSATVLLEHSL